MLTREKRPEKGVQVEVFGEYNILALLTVPNSRDRTKHRRQGEAEDKDGPGERRGRVQRKKSPGV
jgi:hypothetical protein